MTVLLAIDSSTDSLAIALTGPGETRLFEGSGGPKASAQVVPECLRLLGEAGLTLADVDAIAFGRGPGAFTGLRTACSVAQGLALGASKPVLPLDSLMLVAEDARLQAGEIDGPLWVAMDARMDEIYAAQYRFEQGRWRALREPALYAADALVECWGRPAAVAGSALRVFPQLGEIARTWSEEASRARALASLAQQAYALDSLLDAAQAQPLYVRDKVALTTAERMAIGAKA
ncbi:MAG: tRNA (adenosine(37)-N6)-threonylcarbamoyltransferase complex dimerization subunit type 1 TsaB [Paucibacter sp.]|nr:tRNA (adenosine(37)-N6)-threonylcarbamoyltransferase complex dimerization subunit type 1 TsaB [Roseateles sp.]